MLIILAYLLLLGLYMSIDTQKWEIEMRDFLYEVLCSVLFFIALAFWFLIIVVAF